MDYKTDVEKMEVALKQAKIAYDKNEVPVGAAIFDVNNKLICANHNRRELENNPVAHAEILVLQEAAKILKRVGSVTKNILESGDDIARRREAIQADRERVVANQRRTADMIVKS